MLQWNLTRIFALTRSGVVRPTVTRAAAVRHFLAEHFAAGPFFCDDDGAITLPLAASPGGELHLTFQPPNTAARVPRSRSERKKKRRKKNWWWDGVRGWWAHVTRDVAVNPPLLFSWGTTRLRLCKQQHQKHCRLISLCRAELVRHQGAMHCQTAPPTGHQQGARISRCSPVPPEGKSSGCRQAPGLLISHFNVLLYSGT